MAKLIATTADYLSVVAAVVVAPPFAMHIWGKHTALAAIENLMSLGTTSSGNNRYFLQKTADDQTHATERDTASAQANGPNLPDTGWHGYTGNFTSHSLRTISLDGGGTASVAGTRAPTNPDSLYLARSQSGTANAFTGKLAYAAIWNRILTAAEIANLAIMTPLAAAPSGLVAYYILLSNATDTAGANNLTVAGSAGYDTDMPTLGAILPAAAVINVSGQVPTLLRHLTVTPDVGALSMIGRTLALPSNLINPGVGLVTMQGLVPTVNIAVGPSGAPDVGALSMIGLAPTLLRYLTVTPQMNTSEADEQGLVPTIIWGGIAAPSVGAFSMLGLQPLVIAAGSVTVNPGVGLATLGGLAATLAVPAGQEGTALPRVGQVSAIGLTPSLWMNLVVTPDPAQLTMGGLAPDTNTDFNWHDAPEPAARAWHS